MQKFVLPKIGTSMLLAIMVVAVLFFINDRNFDESKAATLQIERSTKVLAALNLLQAQIVDAEMGQRAYLLSGNAMYLTTYNHSTAEINKSLDTLRELIRNNPEKSAIYQQMAGHISRKIAGLELTVRLRKDGNEEAWKYVFATDNGQLEMETIRKYITELTGISGGKIELAKNQIQNTLFISRIGIALFAMTGLLAFYLYLRQSSILLETSLREKEALHRERLQLESIVKERTTNLSQLATHLQNTREEERGDLARALHDEFGSLLTAAKLDVARLKIQLSDTLPDAELRFAHLNSTLNNIIVMTREVVEDLRPSSLSHLGLKTSLEILAREFEKQNNISIATDLENIDIGGASQLTIYRLVQESLTNISKYAKATNVMLSMHNLESHVSVQVRDDGVGFDKDKIDSTHHGLLGMQHRIEALGGKLVITSMPGYGAHIMAAIPAIHLNKNQS